MNQIGLFFYANNQVYKKTYGLQEGKQQGVFLVPPEGHDRVWREIYEKEEGKSYDFWPRGRVVYNTNSKLYNIYHDGCVTQPQLEVIREAFELSEEQVRYLKDDYYTCHECIKKFEDDDMYTQF